MNTTIIACSVRGYELAKELAKKLDEEFPRDKVDVVVRCKSVEESIDEPLIDYVGSIFDKTDRLLFVSAAGIAIRMIAPYLSHKSVDPAIAVMDETGRYCVSLLSGHAGGANEFAEIISDLIGATPVITTATDNEGRFAVDEFARKNDLVISDWSLAKDVSVRILEGQEVCFCSDIMVEGQVPEYVEFISATELPGLSMEKLAVYISNDIEDEGYGEELQVLHLIPKNIVVGLGCKKNTSYDKIKAAIESCMEEQGIDRRSVAAIASIDLKKEESGILEYCHDNEIEFVTYSGEELEELEGEFSESDFVESITGVSHVCERSAMKLALEMLDNKMTRLKNVKNAQLICDKKVYDGVTVALAQLDGGVSF
ncbi:MAG: cobalt-precorrin 5A hydrolase [Wujia sp.]